MMRDLLASEVSAHPSTAKIPHMANVLSLPHRLRAPKRDEKEQDSTGQLARLRPPPPITGAIYERGTETAEGIRGIKSKPLMSRGTNPSLGHLIARICGTRSGDRQTDQLHHCDDQNSEEANHCLTRFYINPKPQTKAENNSMIGCRGGGATM